LISTPWIAFSHARRHGNGFTRNAFLSRLRKRPAQFAARSGSHLLVVKLISTHQGPTGLFGWAPASVSPRCMTLRDDQCKSDIVNADPKHLTSGIPRLVAMLLVWLVSKWARAPQNGWATRIHAPSPLLIIRGAGFLATLVFAHGLFQMPCRVIPIPKSRFQLLIRPFPVTIRVT
jgi:hypothetical protein